MHLTSSILCWGGGGGGCSLQNGIFWLSTLQKNRKNVIPLINMADMKKKEKRSQILHLGAFGRPPPPQISARLNLQIFNILHVQEAQRLKY